MNPRLLLAILALCLGAIADVRAQTVVFNDTFGAGSTINSNPTSPAAPLINKAAYQQLSAKTFSPNPPTIASGHLKYGIVNTSSGFNSIEALFTQYPITLTNTGEYVEMTVVFTNQASLVNAANASIFFGLLNSGQVQPIPGGLNSTVATATAGYAQSWTGFANRIVYSGGTHSIGLRPAQTAAAANNQDVLYNFTGTGTNFSTATTPAVAAFTTGAQYCEVMRITRASATSVTITATLYQGADTSGTQLYTQTGTTSTTPVYTYDALGVGYRAVSGASVMDVNSIKIVTTAATTILPVITTQPLTQTKSVGDALSLSVVANSGGATTPAYQWYKDNVAISGATSSTYSIASVVLGDAGTYKVTVTNAADTTTSADAVVTISTGAVPPTINTHPASATILVGGSNTFTVSASGTATLSYQWQKSTDGGATYPTNVGTNSASHTVTNAALTDAGMYRVVVTNAQGSATSNGAALTVNQAPVVTVQPVGATLAAGASYTLSITATGTPAPTYQWKLNGTNISGATASSYNIASASGVNAGNYSCVVTNSVSAATSNSVYVGVLSAMTTTALTPSNGATGRNRDVLLTITFNQAVSAGTTGRIRIYDASAPATPVETIDLSTATSLTQFGTPYRYMLKTISGSAFAYLPIVVSGNTATICPRSSTALAYNKTYYVNIEPGALLDSTGATFGGISDSTTWAFSTKASGPVATAASITVAANSSGDFDTVQGAVDFIPFSPANTIARTITINDGTYTELVRLRSGQNLVTMQGQSRAGTTIQYLTNNNTTNLLPTLGSSFGSIGQRSVFGSEPNDFTLQNITLRNTTPYTGSQAECFWVGNNAQRMTVSQANILSYQDTFMSNGGVCYLTNCYIEGSVDFIWGSGYTFFNNCELKMVGQTSGGIYVQARNTPSTVPGYFFNNCQLTKGAGVTANGTYLARVDPNTSGGYPYSQVVWMNCRMDTHIIAAGWQLNNATTAPTIKYWEYQSVALDGTTPINTTSRPTYNNAATGVGGSTLLNNQQLDSASATYFSNATNAIGWWPRPAIATQPAPVSATVGQSAGFSVAATSPLAQTYQWKVDGVDISAATSSSYLIPSVTTGSVGTYTVVVTNLAGSTASIGAVLTVQSIIDAWRVANFGSAGNPNAANTADPDSDGVQNAMEFAFGTDPNASSPASVAWTGGTLTTHGLPIAFVETTPTVVNYQAVFTRRLDWIAAGLTYTVQFSPDLATWEDNIAAPSVLATDATHEAVSVPYPLFVNHRKARFFRVAITAP